MKIRNTDANYVKKTGIGVLKGFAPSYGDGVLDSTGQTYTIASEDQIKDAYTDVEKEVLRPLKSRVKPGSSFYLVRS